MRIGDNKGNSSKCSAAILLRLCLESELSHINIAHLRFSIKTNLPKESCLTSVEQQNISPVLDPSKQPVLCLFGRPSTRLVPYIIAKWLGHQRQELRVEVSKEFKVDFGGLSGLPTTMLNNAENRWFNYVTLMNWCLCSLK